MRQETIERKKKASKNKEAVEKILKEEGIGKSISTVEKNKLILKALSNETKLEDDNDDKNENLKKKSFFIREFTCMCGCVVRIEGDLAKDDSITMCSTCKVK
jgi:dihydropteroate synthase